MRGAIHHKKDHKKHKKEHKKHKKDNFVFFVVNFPQ
jgi:hypothetical protein